MKKFLGKKSSKILFIILTLVLTAVYIYMLVRPISYGMTYKNETTALGITTTREVTFLSSKKMKVTTTTGSSTSTVEQWIYCQGGKIAIVDATGLISEETYNKLIESEDSKNAYIKGATYNLNAFGGEGLAGEYKCTGAVVFAIVGGVVELVLITLTALTFVFASKKGAKKNTKKKK